MHPALFLFMNNPVYHGTAVAGTAATIQGQMWPGYWQLKMMGLAL